jgi:hypothetical protein
MPSLLIVDPECGIGNTQYIPGLSGPSKVAVQS